MNKSLLLFILCLTTCIADVAAQNAWTPSDTAGFGTELESLRLRYHIPGFSAGIVADGKLVWKRGFGYADIGQKIMPDENTVYQIASVTKTFGSIILMTLVEEGKLGLNDPIKKYGIHLGGRWGSDERIELKHLLTHTAMGSTWNGFKPGYTFRYNGDWYNRLGKAIRMASGRSFGELLMEQIVLPLHMMHTAPSTDDPVNFALTGYDRDAFLKVVARPYDWQHGRLSPVLYHYDFGSAAGIMSSVADLALYTNAIDEGRFLDSATWQKVFTPFRSPKGKVFPYGLGWFVRTYHGMKTEWHTGWWMGYSALLVRIPEKKLSFIILANSQDLSRPFYHFHNPFSLLGMRNPFRKDLTDDLRGSAFGKAFLDLIFSSRE